jgi:hypothetical protein
LLETLAIAFSTAALRRMFFKRLLMIAAAIFTN